MERFCRFAVCAQHLIAQGARRERWGREKLIEAGLIGGVGALTVISLRWRLRPRTSVPMAYSGVQAGFPSPAESYEESGIDFNVLLIENEKATFVVLRLKGDSMIEAGISEGDLR